MIDLLAGLRAPLQAFEAVNGGAENLVVEIGRVTPLDIDLVPFDPADGLPDGDFYGVLLSYPGASGAVRDLRPVIAAVVAVGWTGYELLRRKPRAIVASSTMSDRPSEHSSRRVDRCHSQILRKVVLRTED